MDNYKKSGKFVIEADEFELMSDDQQDAFRELEREQSVEFERKSRWTANHHPFGDEYDAQIEITGDDMYIQNPYTFQEYLCTPVMQTVYFIVLRAEDIMRSGSKYSREQTLMAIKAFEDGREWFARFHSEAYMVLID